MSDIEQGEWECRCGQVYSNGQLLCDLCGCTRWWTNSQNTTVLLQSLATQSTLLRRERAEHADKEQALKIAVLNLQSAFNHAEQRLSEVQAERDAVVRLNDGTDREVIALRAEQERLREALKPFAEWKLCDEGEPCEWNSGPYCSTHGDADIWEEHIKQARAALSLSGIERSPSDPT